jgi:hypothetical protein
MQGWERGEGGRTYWVAERHIREVLIAENNQSSELDRGELFNVSKFEIYHLSNRSIEISSEDGGSIFVMHCRFAHHVRISQKEKEDSAGFRRKKTYSR